MQETHLKKGEEKGRASRAGERGLEEVASGVNIGHRPEEQAFVSGLHL